MTEQKPESPKMNPTPSTYWIGQDLDWEAATIQVDLRVELPFWLMVPDCVLEVDINTYKFEIEIKEGYIELYAGAISDSRFNCVHFGPQQKLSPELEKGIKEAKVPVLRRKCKTVLIIRTDCNKDVLLASNDTNKRRSGSANLYLKSFCDAHIEVINHLIQRYRLSTYDYFPFEISPWDVPIWFVGWQGNGIKVVLQDYKAWDKKPVMLKNLTDTVGERFNLIEPSDLQLGMNTAASAGEYELLDSLNLMERGDYSGAVRRITTAIEAQTESILRQELLKSYLLPEVEKRLKLTEMNFPLRLTQYQKLSGRTLPNAFDSDLKTTRSLRHSIVHRGRRITFNERAQAERAVNTGRWIFNWLENQPDRSKIRENLIAKRSLGRHYSLYNAEITPAGVTVHKPAGCQ
jgi:hypothetical protein